MSHGYLIPNNKQTLCKYIAVSFCPEMQKRVSVLFKLRGILKAQSAVFPCSDYPGRSLKKSRFAVSLRQQTTY